MGRSRCFNTSRNCVSRSSVEVIKSVQETSLEVQVHWSSTASLTTSMCRGLRSCLTHVLDTSYLSRFKKETEILICFLGIRECVFGTSFLLTLDIYKDYFKGRQRVHKLHKCWAKFVQANCDRRQSFALVHLFWRSCCVCTP